MARLNWLGAIIGAGGMASLMFASAAPVEAAKIVIQRTTVYVSTLPKGCVKTVYSGGVVVWKCGTVYYQPYKGRYVRVYIKTG